MTENDLEILKKKLKNINDFELTELVSKLIQENLYLSQTCAIDPMTDLYNRRILDKKLKVSAVILCDVDDFKSINDIYGHDKGDFVIQMVAKILKNSFRNSDYVCRYGGDEFLILINESEYEFIKQRCEEINLVVNNTIQLPNRSVTLSIGAYLNYDEDPLEVSIKKADEALYYSKNNGKNQVSIYNETIIRK